MSLVPLLFRDWWDDLDRPSRLIDQHFGLGLRHHDLLHPGSLLRTGYIRPWRNITRQDSGSSSITGDKDKFQYCSINNRETSCRFGEEGGRSYQIMQLREAIPVQVILDVQQFAPSEITVKTIDNAVIVEGKHEEKQDEHGYVSRHFVRRYILPSDIEVNNIVSSLSSDGVLTVTAPKKVLLPPSGERVVPIVHTGVPAVKPAEQPIVETPKEVKSES
ncbi:protein lethal(2)essential for life isoform X1 [Cryptotermes secundus]|uniref:protein lethal(2)essential for life isoform X1 n=1 Tax=Cryptotermes secundus TaxID=105785 RepID=UPI001454D313|nr:protein lethal(2)essential for life isoform X1 [Cryptotermes secundus]